MNQCSTAQSREQLTQLGCEVISFPGQSRIPIAELLIELGKRGMTHVLVEEVARYWGHFWTRRTSTLLRFTSHRYWKGATMGIQPFAAAESS